MTNLLEFVVTICFTYSFIYVFKKLGQYENTDTHLELKLIVIISIIEFLLGKIAIKPIELGVYYILLKICSYLIYDKKNNDIFLAYILTFWIFQIADICTGLLLYRTNIIVDFLNEHSLIDSIASQIVVISISLVLSIVASKLKNINESGYIKEKSLLWVYTNVIIIVYMVLIYYYSTTTDTQKIIVISIAVLCFFLFMSYFIFIVLNKLYLEKNERNYIETYNQIIEESLENMKSFKHDHKNILLSIGGFIDSSDMDGLKEYFYKNIANNQYIDNKNLYGLINIKNSPVKGLLNGKISRAILKGINLNVNIENTIENFIIKDIDICKIFGIVIDNAIEASLESNQKILNIGMANDESEIYIIVSNSFKDRPIVHKIFEKGYSTKGINRGLGLSIIRELSEKKYPNMGISTKIKEDLFHMEIILKK